MIPPPLRPMTPGDSLVFDSQQGENEGGSRIVDPSSSPRPLDYQEPLTPSNIGRVSTDFSLGSQTLFNDIGLSISPPRLGFERYFLKVQAVQIRPTPAPSPLLKGGLQRQEMNPSRLSSLKTSKYNFNPHRSSGKKCRCFV